MILFVNTRVFDGSGTSPVPGPENASAALTQAASANWAGYAAAGPAGSYTSVSSSWTAQFGS